MNPPAAFWPEAYRKLLRMLVRAALAPDLRGRIDPSDVIQEVFHDIIRVPPEKVPADPDERLAWLRELLRNNLHDLVRWHRAKGRDPDRELRPEDLAGLQRLERVSGTGLSPRGQVVRAEELARLTDAVAALPADQQEAVERRYLFEDGPDAIAKAMNRTPASVAGLLRRGLAALRVALPSPATS